MTKNFCHCTVLNMLTKYRDLVVMNPSDFTHKLTRKLLALHADQKDIKFVIYTLILDI